MVDRLSSSTSRRDGVAVCDPAGARRRLRHRPGASPRSGTPSGSTWRAGCAPTGGARASAGRCWPGSSRAGAEVHAERHPEAPGRPDGRGRPRRCRRWSALVRRAGLTRGALVPRHGAAARPTCPPRRAVPGVRARARSPGTGTTRCGARTTPPSPSTTAPPSGTPTTWQTLFTGQRAFRPDLSVLALEDGAVVGYALGLRVRGRHARPPGTARSHLGQIGVLPHGPGPRAGVGGHRRGAAGGAADDCAAAGLGRRQRERDRRAAALRGARLRHRSGRSVSWSLDLPPLAEPRA